MNIIETSGLEKIFQAESVETIALRNINFNVKEGDFVAVMGPSGCGKTTLLNILGMIDNWNTGSYFLLGQDVAKLKEKQRTILRKNHIGFVFQNFNLIEELTVYENVELPLQYLGWKKKARQERVTALLEKMQIAHRSNMFPLQLSGGQQQRVAVARAVVANPPLILADEPTGNLDSRAGKEIIEIFKRLNEEGATIVVVTHEKDIAEEAGKIITIRDGVCQSGCY